MEIESIFLHVEEEGKLNLFCYSDKETKLIENIDFATEYLSLIETLDESYHNSIKSAILQLTEEQHMDEPRLLIIKEGETDFLKLSILEIENPEFNINLEEFKERLSSYFLEIKNINK
jgi:hypothetical protein